MLKRTKSLLSLLFQLLSIFLFMALLTFVPEPAHHDSKRHYNQQKPMSKHSNNHSTSKRKKKQQKEKEVTTKQPSSWDQIKNMLTCKQVESSKIHDPAKKNNHSANVYSYCSDICTFRDVVHGNTRVVHRADYSPDGSIMGQETRLLAKKSHHGSSRSVSSMSVKSGAGGVPYSVRGMPLRKFSSCYECHAIVDPRYPSPRTTICACSECGEVFPKLESLEHHQAVRHAVSELGPEDSSRNIVEIIFKSSWLKKDNPICKIERILKVHNTKRTIQRFEDYRDAVKIRANTNAKKNARCAADGNELLRFHCVTLTCNIGANGSSSLCCSIPACGVCTIIRHGFQGNKVNGIRTTASSGRAHDCLGASSDNTRRRAMLVCRVIAGKVKNVADDMASCEDSVSTNLANGSFDSVAGYAGIYSNMEELHVFSSRAILPCFVVIYKAMEY